MGASRYAFNRGVEHLREQGTVANWRAIKTDILDALPSWADATPYQIKSLAIKDACKAVSAAKKKYLLTGEYQRVEFRTKRDPKQSFYIPKSAVRGGGIYPTLSGAVMMTEKLPDNLQDCRLVEESGEWYLCCPTRVDTKRYENQGRVVSIDPGVRTNLRLGGSKTVRSQLDGQRMDRDLNGARGIMLRALVDTPIGAHLRCIGTSATTPSAASIG